MKTQREQTVVAARAMLGDARLLAFLRRCRSNAHIFACTLINRELDGGRCLDAIFYTNDRFGYLLSVKETGPNTFDVAFGCQAAPLAGDGAEWAVSFTPDGAVAEDTMRSQWIS